jgi:hypothetical protein
MAWRLGCGALWRRWRAWIKRGIKRKKERRRRGDRGGEGKGGRTRNTKIPFRSISRKVNRLPHLGVSGHRSKNRNYRHRKFLFRIPRGFANTRRPPCRLHTLIPSNRASCSPPPPSPKSSRLPRQQTVRPSSPQPPSGVRSSVAHASPVRA